MFYDQLVYLCEDRNIKLTPLLKELGMSASGIERWKKGVAPNGDTLLKFAEYFSVSTDYLLTGRNFNNGRETRLIKVYKLPSSAGFGSDISGFGPQYEMRAFPADMVPIKATCGVKIQGDSMEPLIEDGSVVFVRESAYVYNGEIGIFSYFDEAYCKELRISAEGKFSLLSVNPAYPPVHIREPAVLNLLGRVLI